MPLHAELHIGSVRSKKFRLEGRLAIFVVVRLRSSTDDPKLDFTVI